MADTMISCTECGTQCDSHSKFCPACGHPFPAPPVICPSCGKAAKPNDTFCSNCGTRVATPPTTASKSAVVAPADDVVEARTYFKQASITPQPPTDGTDAQPLWTPPVTVAPAADNATQPLWTPPTSDDTNAEDAIDDDDAEDDDEDVAPEPTKGKKSGKKRKKETAESEAKRKAELFQKTANEDGYYDDQRTIDEGLYEENTRQVQTLRLILGVVGIALFFFVVIKVQSMFM